MSKSSERAYDFIRSAILSGKYPSGERLTEDAVANEMGLSRTPVREAMRRLHAEQFLTMTPYSGARVTSWSMSELAEIAQFRLMVEPYAARLAAQKRSPAQLAHMKALCAGMEAEAANPKRDLMRFTADNLDLHRTIVAAADNARLLATIEPLLSVPLAVRKFSLFGAERLQRSLVHHREIVEAIEAQDPDWAEAIMRVHIISARAYDAALVAD